MTGGVSPIPDGQRLGPISETVGLLLDLTDHLKARFATVSAGVGLSMAQARTLLRIRQPVSMRELAALTQYDASNMTGIVEGLHMRGLVERQISLADRRVRHIVLTDEGVALQERLRHALTENVPAIGKLTASERSTLHEILRRALDRA